jgi:carbonic anhydrase/acetyltransferase-like protein (isoleucine patch superfamily)
MGIGRDDEGLVGHQAALAGCRIITRCFASAMIWRTAGSCIGIR